MLIATEFIFTFNCLYYSFFTLLGGLRSQMSKMFILLQHLKLEKKFEKQYLTKDAQYNVLCNMQPTFFCIVIRSLKRVIESAPKTIFPRYLKNFESEMEEHIDHIPIFRCISLIKL